MLHTQGKGWPKQHTHTRTHTHTHVHRGRGDDDGPPTGICPGLKDVVGMCGVSAWLWCIQLLRRVVPKCCEQLETKSFTSIQMFHTHRGRVKQQFNIYSDVPHTGGKMTKTTPTSTGGRGGEITLTAGTKIILTSTGGRGGETTPTAGTTTGGGKDHGWGGGSQGAGRWGPARREEEEGGRRKEEGGRRKEEGGRRKEEGGRRKEEGGRRKEEGRRRATHIKSNNPHLAGGEKKL